MSKRKSDVKKVSIDLSKTYLMRINKKGDKSQFPAFQHVRVSLSPNSSNMIRCDVITSNDEFDPAYLYDDYFAWLLYTGKILEFNEV